MLPYISVSRNIVNTEEVDQFISELEKEFKSEKARLWVKKKFRKFILNDYADVAPIINLPYNAPDWMKNAFENGDSMFKVNLDTIKERHKILFEYVDSEDSPNLDRISYEDLVKKAEEWDDKRENPDEIETLHEHKGHRIVILKSQKEFAKEGEKMGNCLGTLQNYNQNLSYYVYSVRDPQNNSIVSIELRIQEGHIAQIKGKQNHMLSEKYIKIARYFLNYLASNGYQHSGRTREVKSSDDEVNIKALFSKEQKRFIPFEKLPTGKLIPRTLHVNATELELPKIKATIELNPSVESFHLKGKPIVNFSVRMVSRLKELKIDSSVYLNSFKNFGIESVKLPDLYGNEISLTGLTKQTAPKVINAKFLKVESSASDCFEDTNITAERIKFPPSITINSIKNHLKLRDYRVPNRENFHAKNKEIGTLILSNKENHTIDKTVTITEALITRDSTVELEHGYVLKGSLDASNAKVIYCNNLVIEGDARFSDYGLYALPNNMLVKGNLYLNGSKITTVDNIEVEGDLFLGKSMVDSLPKSLKVKGKIHANLNYLKEIDESFIKSKKIIWKN